MIVADHPLPLVFQTRLWRLGIACLAALPASGLEARAVWCVAPVLDKDGIVVDLAEAPTGDEEGPIWQIAMRLTGAPGSDRLGSARRCERMWLTHVIRWRAEHEGRELVDISGPDLNELIEATHLDALHDHISPPSRPRWLPHHVALHVRRIPAGRELTAHERLREGATLVPLRRHLEVEARAAAAWWREQPFPVRRSHEEVGAEDEAERQLGARRAHLAMVAEWYVDEFTAQEAALARKVGAHGRPGSDTRIA